MILIIPAIELIEGQCKYCIKGERGTDLLYKNMSANPVRLIKLLRRENSKTVHLTDHDSYRHSSSNKQTLLYLANNTDIPIQLLANFISTDECRYYLDNGIYRILINQLVYTDPEGVRKLINDYTQSRIAFSIKVRNKKSYFSAINREISENVFINDIKEFGANRLIYGDKSWEVGGNSPDLIKLKKLAMKSDLRITLFKGITTPQQLWQLQEYSKQGLDSVVLGSALFDNNFPCQKLWRKIEAELEPGLQ